MTHSRWITLLDRLLRAMALSAVLALLVQLGMMVAREKIDLVKEIQFIGHGDEAAYAAMGESIAAGNGLTVRYISWHFLQYPPEVTRREDHWPPFMGLSIAPCFLALGKQPWVAKLPAIFFGSLGLPLITALLTYALSRRGFAALAAGLLMAAHPVLYSESLKTLSDIAAAMLLAGFCWGLISAWRFPAMHLVAGAFAAAAYFAKGSEIILIVLYPLLAMLSEGPRVFTRRWIYLGMLTAVTLAAPYWYSNWKVYGSSLHSTQNYVAGYIGMVDWEEGTYPPYWSGRGAPLPKLSDRWTKYGPDYPARVSENREAIARAILTASWLGESTWDDFGRTGALVRRSLLAEYTAANRNDPANALEKLRSAYHEPVRPISQWQAPPWELAGLAATALSAVTIVVAVLYLAWMPISLLVCRIAGRRAAPSAEIAPAPTVPASMSQAIGRPAHLVGAILALTLLILVHALFIDFFWEAQIRFLFIFFPLVAALGCTAAALALDIPLHFLGRAATALGQRVGRAGAALEYLGLLRNWHVLATLVVVAWIWFQAPQFRLNYLPWKRNVQVSGGSPYIEQTRYVTAGKWIGQNLPNAVVMARNPWELLFYCASTNKSVNYPLDHSAEFCPTLVFSVAKYYHVTHIYDDCDVPRPGLDRYFAGRDAGLRQVPDGPRGLYEIIDYKMLPVREMDELFPPASPPAYGASTKSAMR